MSEQINTQKKQKVSQTSPIDLTIGNPVFMQEYWNLIAKYYNGSMGMTRIHPNENLSYNYKQNNDKLRDAIKSVHKLVGNAETDGYNIVFGNGASQLVSAAAYAVKEVYNPKFITYNEPVWPRIKFLLQHGVSASSSRFGSTDVEAAKPGNYDSRYELLVVPNNPDGSLCCGQAEPFHQIRDLCYNWPQYTSVVKHKGNIMIFGLAKATGHAGTRFGWALVKDAEVAEAMRRYVELTTSGVSEDAQSRAYIVLDTLSRLKKEEFMDCFKAAESELSGRWATFLSVANQSTDFVVKNKNGMFAWCEIVNDLSVDQINDKLFIRSIEGKSFGASEKHFRLSLGCSKEDFNSFIQRLSQTYGTKTKKP